MIDLILITAACHCKSVIRMADEVKHMQDKFKNINIRWVICVDRYNKDGEMGPVYEELFKKDISWISYSCGKPNQWNCGGDMFNEPLRDVLANEYEGKDPWIYIYDDDNRLCEKMFVSLEHEYDPSGKRIAWMHYITSVGDLVKVNPYECFTTVNVGNYWIYRYNPDPSAIMFKASVFTEYGGFNGGVDYDFTSVRNMCETFVDEIVYDDMYDNRYTVFHNGNKTYERKDVVDKITNGDSISAVLLLQRNDKGNEFTIDATVGNYVTDEVSIPVLNKDKIMRILDIIYEGE